MKDNDDQGICYPQPKTLGQRVAIAKDFAQRFHYTIPLAVDRMDNRADGLYGAWPERIYVIDESGRVVYKGKLGPFGFHPEELEEWLARRFPAGNGGVRTAFLRNASASAVVPLAGGNTP
jgi:iodothyronine deiodinase-like protein